MIYDLWYVTFFLSTCLFLWAKGADAPAAWAAIGVAAQSILYLYGNKILGHSLWWPLALFTVSGFMFLFMGSNRIAVAVIGILAFINVILFSLAIIQIIPSETGKGIAFNIWNWGMIVLYGQLFALAGNAQDASIPD